jgi:hypothetical protein
VAGPELAAIALVGIVGIALFVRQNRAESRSAVAEACRSRRHDHCLGIAILDDGNTAACLCSCHQPAQVQPPFL